MCLKTRVSITKHFPPLLQARAREKRLGRRHGHPLVTAPPDPGPCTGPRGPSPAFCFQGREQAGRGGGDSL